MGKAPVTIAFHPGSMTEVFHRAQQELHQRRFAERLLARDPSLFVSDPSPHPAIVNRLGWLESFKHMREALPELLTFAKEVTADGLNQVVLFGMGGSSLCPEVLGKVYGLPEHLDTYIVLDSTAPSAVEAAARATFNWGYWWKCALVTFLAWCAGSFFGCVFTGGGYGACVKGGCGTGAIAGTIGCAACQFLKIC